MNIDINPDMSGISNIALGLFRGISIHKIFILGIIIIIMALVIYVIYLSLSHGRNKYTYKDAEISINKLAFIKEIHTIQIGDDYKDIVSKLYNMGMDLLDNSIDINGNNIVTWKLGDAHPIIVTLTFQNNKLVFKPNVKILN